MQNSINRRQIALIVILLTVGVQAFAQTDLYCADQWSPDSEMVSYCISQQNKAQNEVFELASYYDLVIEGTIQPKATNNDIELLLYNCMRDWREPKFDTFDYTMVIYCWKNQIDSYTNIHGERRSSAGLSGYCANEWNSDYEMQEYCLNQQLEAMEEFFNLAKSFELLTEDNKLDISFVMPNSQIETIFVECLNDWSVSQFETYDYTMVTYCINSELGY